MFGRNKSTVFPLDIVDREDRTFQYFINISSGERKLRMLVDSGSTNCQIMESSLKDCHYEFYPQCTNVMMADGSIKSTPIAALSVGILDYKRSKKFYCTLNFIVMPNNSFHSLDGTEIDGLIGSNFLQNCAIDFLHGVVKLYLG